MTAAAEAIVHRTGQAATMRMSRFWTGCAAGRAGAPFNGLYAAACVILPFPAIVLAGAFLLVLLFAWGAFRLWDEPMRAWLKRRLLRSG